MAQDPRLLLKVHTIIHSASVAAAACSAAFASAPVVGPLTADCAGLFLITQGMIGGVAAVHGQSPTMGTIISALGGQVARYVGIAIFKAAASMIPIAGNGLNAAVSFTVTEAMGWGTHMFFAEGRRLEDAAPGELQRYAKRGKEYASQLKAQHTFDWIDQLPEGVKQQYDQLCKQLADKSLSADQRRAIMAKIDALLTPYVPAGASPTPA